VKGNNISPTFPKHANVLDVPEYTKLFACVHKYCSLFFYFPRAALPPIQYYVNVYCTLYTYVILNNIISSVFVFFLTTPMSQHITRLVARVHHDDRRRSFWRIIKRANTRYAQQASNGQRPFAMQTSRQRRSNTETTKHPFYFLFF